MTGSAAVVVVVTVVGNTRAQVNVGTSWVSWEFRRVSYPKGDGVDDERRRRRQLPMTTTKRSVCECVCLCCCCRKHNSNNKGNDYDDNVENTARRERVARSTMLTALRLLND